MTKYIICAATDGGFVVQKILPMVGFPEAFAFAGSLTECLDYLRRQFPDPSAVPPPAPPPKITPYVPKITPYVMGRLNDTDEPS